MARFEPEDEDREPVLFVFQRLETEDDVEEEEEEEEEEVRSHIFLTYSLSRLHIFVLSAAALQHDAEPELS